jgi:hypothetical protein
MSEHVLDFIFTPHLLLLASCSFAFLRASLRTAQVRPPSITKDTSACSMQPSSACSPEPTACLTLLLLLPLQVHPGSSQLCSDDDGLLPEWLIYHEFVATSRPFLRQVRPPILDEQMNE